MTTKPPELIAHTNTSVNSVISIFKHKSRKKNPDYTIQIVNKKEKVNNFIYLSHL